MDSGRTHEEHLKAKRSKLVMRAFDRDMFRSIRRSFDRAGIVLCVEVDGEETTIDAIKATFAGPSGHVIVRIAFEYEENGKPYAVFGVVNDVGKPLFELQPLSRRGNGA